MVVANSLSGTVRTLLLLVICVPLGFSLLRFKFQWRPVVLFAYLSCIIFINILRDTETGNYILLFVPLFIGFITSVTVRFDHLVHVFTNIMVFLAAFSLVLLLIRVLQPGVLGSLPYLGQVYETRARAHDGFFAVTILNSQYIRNYGLAWEPGAFAILLSSALYCKLTFYKKISVVHIAILTIALITTFSTMGYFVLAIIYIVSLKRGFKNKKATIIVLIGVVLLLVSFVLLPESVKDLVFSKISGLFTGSATETTQARLDAIEYPGKAFFSSPVLGVGYDRFSFINQVYCNNVATNTIANWFAIMGILFGLPSTYGYLSFATKCTRYSRGNIVTFLVLAFGFVLMVSTESLLRISFIYTVIFYGVQNNLFWKNAECIAHKHHDR